MLVRSLSAFGKFTRKTVDGTTITYKVDENNNVVEQTDGTNTIKFVYDSNNSPIYMDYNGVIYYYERNLQGDIVALLDSSGDTVVEYSYDIWGKLLGITGKLADTLGIANPLRYRGYYYDTETGLYYLQSRYYSPDLMRFISQDDPTVLQLTQGDLLGSNLYIYCNNNPANDSDPTGCLSLNSALAKVSELLNKIVNKLTNYFKKLIRYKNGRLMISTTVISTTIDAIIATVINSMIYRGVKTAMKTLLRNGSIRKSFINGLFNFFLYNKAGKLFLKTFVRIGCIIAGKKGAIGTIVDSVMKDFLANIAFSKSRILQKASSLISALSSVGGIVALIADIMDRKWDNYVSLRI